MKLVKYVLNVLLIVASVSFAADWTGASTEPSTTKTIEGKKYYVITNADELAWFSAQVNDGQTTINGYLNNDIYFVADKDSVSKFSWTPIGNSEELSFNGVFEGNNHGVYGLLINKEDVSLYGFFGVIGESGVVRNLSVKANVKNNNNRNGTLSYSSDMSGLLKITLGGVAAVNYGNIENCHTFGYVAASRLQSAQNLNAGGIVGWNYGTIKNVSINQSSISSQSYSYDIYYAGSCGGVAGTNEGTIEYALNNSPVSPRSSYSGDGSRAGGIAGVNKGTINKSVNKGLISGRIYIGGIVGTNSSSAVIYDCINEGNFSNSHSDVGALVGYNSGVLKTSFSITNAITFSSNNQVGGVIGYEYGLANTCYFDSELLADFPAIGYGSATNVSGKTTADMQKDQFAWILNTANGTEENSGVWSRYDGYPVFANDTLLPIRKIVFDDGENTTIYYTNFKGGVPEFPEVSQAPEGKAFAGWVDAGGNACDLTTVFTEDQTVTASFLDWEDVLYTVQFLDEKGKLLDKTTVHSGETPTYSGDEPVKQENAAYTYSFAKWTPELSAVTWHTDFVATFDSTLKKYKVTYNDFDGTELYSSDFDYGTKPSYSTIPTRATTDQYIYTFSGWTPEVELVSQAATYKAQYDSTLREYEITFKNGDKTLSASDFAYGVKPSYSGDTPTKAATKQYSYTFKGWNPEIAAVSKATTYEAVFDSVLNKYTIAFTDGIKILQSSDGDYGSMPDYTKSEPIKESSSKYDYKFKAWTPALAKITDDATYTAVFDSTIRKFEVSFVNGKTTLQSGKAEYGSMPSYSGDGPTKKASEGYTYSFAGWEPTITSVNKDVIYKAVFDSTAKKFKVVFMNGKDTLQSSSVEYNVLPKYNGKEPKKDKTKKYTYTFAGWDKTIVAVTENAVYKAVFDSTETQGIALTSASNGGFMVSSIGNKQIAIQGIVAGKKFHVMDMQGRIIVSGKLALSNVVIPVYSAGTYIVQVENSIKMVNVK